MLEKLMILSSSLQTIKMVATNLVRSYMIAPLCFELWNIIVLDAQIMCNMSYIAKRLDSIWLKVKYWTTAPINVIKDILIEVVWLCGGTNYVGLVKARHVSPLMWRSFGMVSNCNCVKTFGTQALCRNCLLDVQS